MVVDSSEFRRILGHWTTGVAVVTSYAADALPRGLTANAVASVSLDPPLVLACVDRSSHTHDSIHDAGCFAINILEQSGESTARRFAGDDVEDKFAGVAWHTEATGAPVLDEALAWVDCRVRESVAGGDHTIYIGEVVAGDAAQGEPLVYFRGGYHSLTP